MNIDSKIIFDFHLYLILDFAFKHDNFLQNHITIGIPRMSNSTSDFKLGRLVAWNCLSISTLGNRKVYSITETGKQLLQHYKTLIAFLSTLF